MSFSIEPVSDVKLNWGDLILAQPMTSPIVISLAGHIYELAVVHVHQISKIVNQNLAKNRREHEVERNRLDDDLTQLHQDQEMRSRLRLAQCSQPPFDLQDPKPLFALVGEFGSGIFCLYREYENVISRTVKVFKEGIASSKCAQGVEESILRAARIE